MSKPHIMFVPVNRSLVIGDLADLVIFQGYAFPSGVTSNDAAEAGGEKEDTQRLAQEHFSKAIALLHLHRLLEGSGYNRVRKLVTRFDRTGAYVEFPDRDTAILFKLSQ